MIQLAILAVAIMLIGGSVALGLIALKGLRL